MRERVIMVMVALAVACQSPTSNGICSARDRGSPCAQPTEVRAIENGWHVEIRETRTRQESYRDGGHLCARTVTSCHMRSCTFSFVGDGPIRMTADEALQECAARG